MKSWRNSWLLKKISWLSLSRNFCVKSKTISLMRHSWACLRGFSFLLILWFCGFYIQYTMAVRCHIITWSFSICSRDWVLLSWRALDIFWGKQVQIWFTFLYVDDLKIYEVEEKVVQLPPSSCYCLATIAAYLAFATDVELAQCSGGPRACAIYMSS